MCLQFMEEHATMEEIKGIQIKEGFIKAIMEENRRRGETTHEDSGKMSVSVDAIPIKLRPELSSEDKPLKNKP